MATNQLRVLAVAAPYWPRRSSSTTLTLGSRVPFSLQNACRLAAGMAKSGQGAWGNSNWAKVDLNDVVVMYDYADDLDEFQQKIEAIQPNLLLIGAMTLALPGAIEIALIAKVRLGDRVTIVLGGKHASETIYREQANVLHSVSSPLCLMSEGKIPPLFDVVVSGDGEQVIAKLGELVAIHDSAKKVIANLGEVRDCAGNWIVGSIKNAQIQTIISTGTPIDYASLPIPAEIFGFQSSFEVFGTDRTAHVYSDTSRGCMYDCFFCTERSTVNGQPKLKGAAERLLRQIKATAGSGKDSGDRVSAFVEDSILLMGNNRELENLYQLLKREPVQISFGGQMTVDLLIRKETQTIVRKLKEVGLSYLFVGLETGNEAVAMQMSKNVHSKGQDWMVRNEQIVKFMTEAGLKYGVSVLFGLGESQADRVRLLKEIARWQKEYSGNPCVVSLNWATQHPLLNVGRHDYVEWGTEADSELLPFFQSLFGEASEKYLVGGQKPTIEELRELGSLFSELNLEQ